ncbi:MAG TPA: GTP-binding protein [Acetobacteraceae bacterium]|nr:GTP-binding protein [Acetobacteraceae bacterium]
MTAAGRRAVTVLSGFLGSGKTTLLRRYLAGHSGAGVVVIINECGAVGVDHHLVRMVQEQSVVLQGGCVCCTRREDLVGELRELLDLEQSGRLAPLRHVVIETSGIADPVPVLFSLATDPVLRHHFAPASVVVTLDALNAAAQIDRQPEVRKQIIAADRIVVTKADLAPREAIAHHRIRVRQLNPTAKISVSRMGDASEVLAAGAAADADADADHVRRLPADYDPGALSTHAGVRSIALGFNVPLDWPVFGVWLGMLLQVRGPDVLRIKGLLDIGDAGPVVMNAAQHVVHPPEHLPAWPAGADRSYLVFITRGIDPARIAESLETFQRAGGRSDLRVRELA